MPQDLKKMYRSIMDDHFPPRMEISFLDGSQRQTLVYDKASWVIDGIEKGLRYGENPGQEAALYKLVNGNLVLGEVQNIQPGRYLASEAELLQSGKHPGKTNLTDARQLPQHPALFHRPTDRGDRQTQQPLRGGAVAEPGFMALHDNLTGLANRHQFSLRGQDLFSLAKRSHRPLTLLNIDINDVSVQRTTSVRRVEAMVGLAR